MSEWDIQRGGRRHQAPPPQGPPAYGGGYDAPPGVTQPYQPPSGQQGPSRARVAEAALIVGLVSFVVPVLGGVAAVILGIIGLVQVSRSNGARTGTGFAATGLILGLLTTGGYGALFASDDFQRGVRDALAEAMEEGFADQQDGSLGIEPGDCLDVEVADSSDFQLNDGDVVPCDQPHGAEYAGRATLTNPVGDPYPGEDEVFLDGLDLCLDTFVRYVGVDLAARPELDILVVYPQEVSWRATGDRNVDCLIINADASPLEGPVVR